MKAENQWFVGSPLPLMEWYQLNHWYQWFFNGFSDSQPSVTMVFDGCQPLVQRCDGNDTSLQSNWVALQWRMSFAEAGLSTYSFELAFLWYRLIWLLTCHSCWDWWMGWATWILFLDGFFSAFLVWIVATGKYVSPALVQFWVREPLWATSILSVVVL